MYWLMGGLAAVYLLAFVPMSSGWGYPGYGYRPYGSFMYWGGPTYYHDPSVRQGSLGGPSHRGGGPRSGK
ncbi:MAG: hypothetical protein MJD61_00490 [Proteobacteria bacterium]|nr:hypothetical protein [Pseudomonadota bacterium]